MNDTQLQVQALTFVVASAISEAQMRALETAGEFTTYVSHVGGHGDVSIAEPLNGRGGPRYEFDAARRVWFPILPVTKKGANDGTEN